MLLIKEGEQVQVVTDDMMNALNHIEEVSRHITSRTFSMKIHLIKALRIASEIKYGKAFGLKECKLFVETHCNWR